VKTSHVAGNEARIRKVRKICCTNQVSDLILVHKCSILQPGVRDHWNSFLGGLGLSRGPRVLPHAYCENGAHGGHSARRAEARWVLGPPCVLFSYE
jgi:hypothetical protein